MGFKFRSSRRSIKIAPGVRVNIGKKGLSSLSVGGRGKVLGATANLNLQTGKVKGTYSVKGVGSIQVSPDSPTARKNKPSSQAQEIEPVIPVTPAVETEVVDKNNLKWYQHTWLIVLLIIFLPPVSIPVIWIGQWSKLYKVIGTGCALLWFLCLLPLN